VIWTGPADARVRKAFLGAALSHAYDRLRKGGGRDKCHADLDFGSGIHVHTEDRWVKRGARWPSQPPHRMTDMGQFQTLAGAFTNVSIAPKADIQTYVLLLGTGHH